MANLHTTKTQTRAGRREARARRVRARIRGTAERPRLSVFRSGRHIYAQLIDDARGATLATADDRALTGAKKKSKRDSAFRVGQLIAERANGCQIKAVVFDRAGYRYAGRVQALADGARAGGLKF